MTADHRTHDILKGVLNSVGFDIDAGDDPLMDIPPVPCEVCGKPVWLGIIISTCGDVHRAVHSEWPEADGFQDHYCDGSTDPDYADCEICFGDEDEEYLPVSTPVVRFLTEPPAWTTVPVAR